MKKFLLVFALAMLTATSAFAGQLLQNGGFESGSLSPWYNARNFCFGTCVNWNVSTTNPYAGTYSATDEGNIELRQDFAATPGSMITNISFYVDSAAGIDAFDLFYSDGTDNEFVVFPTAGVWTYENVTSFVDTTKSLTGFSIFGASPNIVTYVDNASITSAVPEPSSLLMLGSGIFALAGAIRRRLSV